MTDELRNRVLVADIDKPIDVIIEIDPSFLEASLRGQTFARLRHLFEQAIQDAGGTVMELSWLSGTIRAQIPLTAIEKIAQLEQVKLIDTPHQINPEQRQGPAGPGD